MTWRCVVLCCGLSLSCTSLEPQHSVPNSGAPHHETPAMPVQLPAELHSLTFGLVPFLSAQTMLRTHEKLRVYLSEALHVPVEIRVADSYEDAILRLQRGEFDLVELSPMAYVEASRRIKLNCLVQTIADGSATASGYIVVREDSPRKTLGDLKGARLGLVDPMSTSGALFAKKILKDYGFDLTRDFAQVSYLGNHEAVLLAVLAGEVDAGATYQGAFSALRRSQSIDPLMFRVVAKTPRSPRDIFCVRAETHPAVATAITRAVMALSSRDSAGRAVLGPLDLNGFVVADDSAYSLVRQVAAELVP